ncbi:MAG: hypothetical protein CL739_01140 [Chloroflexi bacterium]|nr:hypothetical protein [Chloroflexota bacterium]
MCMNSRLVWVNTLLNLVIFVQGLVYTIRRKFLGKKCYESQWIAMTEGIMRVKHHFKGIIQLFRGLNQSLGRGLI